MTTTDAPAYTHYLLTITTAGKPVQGDALAIELRNLFFIMGVTPLAATSYASSLLVNPKDVALKDTWLTLTESEQDTIRGLSPHLVTAIELICGIRKEDYVR